MPCSAPCIPIRSYLRSKLSRNARPSVGKPIVTRLMQSGTISIAFLFSGIFIAMSVGSLAQIPATHADGIADNNLDIRVESILRQMTLEEKVGQLVQYSAGQPTGPGTGRSDYGDMIAHGQISSLFNVIDPHEINQYQKIAMEKSRLHIPILFGLDVIHGFKTEFPIPLGLAST